MTLLNLLPGSTVIFVTINNLFNLLSLGVLHTENEDKSTSPYFSKILSVPKKEAITIKIVELKSAMKDLNKDGLSWN